MAPWVRYLIAFVVFAHGFVYVRIGSVLPGTGRRACYSRKASSARSSAWYC